MTTSFKMDTTRFGEITVNQDDVITMPDGPLGFPDCTRWTFIDEERAAPFRMLQSLDNQALAFVMCDPRMVQPDYSFDVGLDDLELIDAVDTDGLAVYSVVTMCQNIHDVTINLQGPMVFNLSAKLGHQFVLSDSGYTTRETFLQPLT